MDRAKKGPENTHGCGADDCCQSHCSLQPERALGRELAYLIGALLFLIIVTGLARWLLAP